MLVPLLRPDARTIPALFRTLAHTSLRRVLHAQNRSHDHDRNQTCDLGDGSSEEVLERGKASVERRTALSVNCERKDTMVKKL